MVASYAPEQLEKSARNLLACAKWMLAEKQARLKENRPAMKEAEIDKNTRELFGTNWGSAYNALKILEKLGEEYIEKAIKRGIAFSALYAFTHEDDPQYAYDLVTEALAREEIVGRPSHDKLFDYLKKLPKEMKARPPVEEREPENTQTEETESADLSALDSLLSPYQTRQKPYVKPQHGLVIMKTPAHLPISRGRRAVIDSRNELTEESLAHMKIYLVAQASNGRVYVSRHWSWLTMEHFARENKKNVNKEEYINKRCKEMRAALEVDFKKRGLYLVFSEEVLSAARDHIVQFLRKKHYMVGEYKE